MRSVIFAVAVYRSLAATCCWSKWGDASSCGNYPAGGTGPICGNDGVTVCQNNADCDNPVPPTTPTTTTTSYTGPPTTPTTTTSTKPLDPTELLAKVVENLENA